MIIKNIVLGLIVTLAILQVSYEIRFVRRIQAIGSPYYKILMYLGHCKKSRLYSEKKIWGKVPMNRVLDIHYKGGDRIYTVSRVEIHLIVNNTNTIAFSEDGVGGVEFFAALYLPMNTGFVLYRLVIYTCSKIQSPHHSYKEEPELYLPFIKLNT